MKKKTNLFASHLLPLAVTTAALMQFSMTGASAATYYWDSNSTTAGFGSANGIWGTSTFWSTSSAGTGTTANTTIAAADDINFGTSTDGYTGTVTLNADKLANSLTFGGASGAITFLGNGTARKLTLGDMGGITMNAGAGAVTFGDGTTAGNDVVLTLPPTSTSRTAQVWTNNSASDFTINTVAAFTRATGNALVFNPTSTGNFKTGTSTALPNNVSTGIIGTWAFFGTGANTKYAYNNSGTIAAYTGTAATDASGLTDTTGFVNYDLADATGTVPATVSANTIRYNGSGGTTAPGATSFTVNGLLNAGSGLWTIGTNKITIGSDKELVINAATNDITISSIIANNGANASALTKLGSGTLTLAGDSTFTGAIRILDGVVKAGKDSSSKSAGPFGNTNNASVFLANTSTAGLDTNGYNVYVQSLAGGGALGGNVTLSSGKTLTITAPNSTYAGIIGGGGNVAVNGSQAQTFNGLNTYTGYTSIGNNSTFLILLNVNSLANGGNNSSLGASSADAANLVFNGAGGLIYNSSVDGNTDRLFTLSGTGTTAQLRVGSTGAMNFTNTGAITVTGGAKTLLLQSASSGLGTGNGSIAASIGDGTAATTIQKGSSTSAASTDTWSLTSESNSFTGSIISGTTTVAAGTLAYASAGGANPITFLQTTGTGTISYIGNSDREMSGAITATALTTGAITLDSSGLGAINYSNTGSLGNSAASGAKGLVLSGTNTGNNILAGIWENNTAGGAATLTKSGTGKWILSGTNTYTGATTISGGTLLINGNSSGATGAVAVNGTSTLGGNGTIGGNVTVAATANLAPGAAAATAGTLSIGGNLDISAPAGDVGLLSYDLDALANPNDKIAVTGTLTIGTGTLGFTDFAFNNLGGLQNGTYTLITSGGINPGDSLNSGDLSGSIGAGGTGTLQITGNNIELVVSGLGGGPGPVDHFDISAIGSPQTVGTPITGITLTAKDASNNTATGFTGTVTFGGTGGFSGTSASFSAGVLSGVSVTPTIAGSGLTFTVNDGSGHTGTTTITTIQTQYEAWAGGAAFDADANGDGVKNGLAWLLGASSPTSAVTRPTVTQSGGNLTMSFTCLNAASRGSAVLNVQHSSDLGITDAWTTVAVPETSGGPTSGVTFTVTPGSPSNSVTATISSSEAAAGKLFGRLKANP